MGPAKPFTQGQLVEAARSTFAPRAKVQWVPEQWLLSQPDPEKWGTLLFWSRGVGPIMRMSNQRALEKGLTTRPVATTLRDSLAWYRKQPADEQASLTTGFRRNADGTFSPSRASWADYLAREKELLMRTPLVSLR